MRSKIARQIVLAARPHGRPKLSDSDFKRPDPHASAGQVLLRVQYLSLDPYMRGRMDDRKSYAHRAAWAVSWVGIRCRGHRSHHPGYSEGDVVLAQTGWRTHALSDRRNCASSIRPSRRSRRA